MPAEQRSGHAIPHDLVTCLRALPEMVVLTGAGVSAESGVPTFRDAQSGLWARYDPMELATPEAFARDPELVWRWYRWRRELIREARPNAAHRALAALEQRLPRLTLVTQNVDGLHGSAGSKNVLELHGNIHRTICSRERAAFREAGGATPPRCPRCDAPGRPDVVWFGEALPMEALDEAFRAAAGCELFISIGTSSVVEPAASLAHAALEHGAAVVEINPQRTPLTDRCRHFIAGKAGVVLPALVREAFGQGV